MSKISKEWRLSTYFFNATNFHRITNFKGCILKIVCQFEPWPRAEIVVGEESFASLSGRAAAPHP